MHLTIYLITNIFIIAMLYIGYNHHIDVALTIGHGFVWGFTFCCFALPFLSKESQMDTFKNLAVPPLVDLMISIGIASYLMSQGSWKTGAAFFIGSLIWASVIANYQKELAKTQPLNQQETPKKSFHF